MPVVSAPCSCQPDCLVCCRGDVSPHDCAIHVLLESMVFQERMLYGEPTEARLEEILQCGKEYLPRAMHMTDQNSVRWQTMYHYVKSGFPRHLSSTPRGDPQPCFPTHTILLDPLLGTEWFNPVVFHSPSKVPFCFSLEPIKSHFLLLSSIKTGLGSHLPHRHRGRARLSSLPDPIPGSASL
ncbi:uncharacterized protein TNCV_1615001 [Trichonephila clavipes]|nr:uncharacterized protein TNCV_1615001 [Trichonephila clavipes]